MLEFQVDQSYIYSVDMPIYNNVSTVCSFLLLLMQLPMQFDLQALNRDLAYKWQKWADFPQDALDTIVEGGYYNIRIMDNLRLISFNSDYGYIHDSALELVNNTVND